MKEEGRETGVCLLVWASVTQTNKASSRRDFSPWLKCHWFCKEFCQIVQCLACGSCCWKQFTRALLSFKPVFKASSVFLSLTHITKGWDWKNACRSVPASESSRYCRAWAIRYSINLASSIPPPPNDSEELILFLGTFNFQSKLVISSKLHPHHLMFLVGVSNHFKSRQWGKDIRVLSQSDGFGWINWHLLTILISKEFFCLFLCFLAALRSSSLDDSSNLKDFALQNTLLFPACPFALACPCHGSEHRMPLWCGCALCWAGIESWAQLLRGGWAGCHVETCSPKLWALSL